MRYVALIYGDETWFERQSEEDQRAHLQRWSDYSDALQAAGVASDGVRLAPTGTARSIRARGGGPMVTDGPFAETREQLCGYIALEAETIDEAVGWAERCPATRNGTVEVRPVIPE
jgi:hypothetical protein